MQYSNIGIGNFFEGIEWYIDIGEFVSRSTKWIIWRVPEPATIMAISIGVEKRETALLRPCGDRIYRVDTRVHR